MQERNKIGKMNIKYISTKIILFLGNQAFTSRKNSYSKSDYQYVSLHSIYYVNVVHEVHHLNIKLGIHKIIISLITKGI